MGTQLIRANINDEFDGRWGRFLPYLRLNVDQMPLSFVFNKNSCIGPSIGLVIYSNILVQCLFVLSTMK